MEDHQLTEGSNFNNWSTWALISIPSLDTSFNESDIAEVDRVLRQRGIVGSKRLWMRVFSFVGLLYNGLRGEWIYLDLQDIIHGWSLNAFVLTFLAVKGITFDYAGNFISFPAASFISATVACIALSFCAFLLTRHFLRRWLGSGT